MRDIPNNLRRQKQLADAYEAFLDRAISDLTSPQSDVTTAVKSTDVTPGPETETIKTTQPVTELRICDLDDIPLR